MMIETIHVPLYAIRHRQIGGTEFAVYNLVRGLVAASHVVLSYGRDADLSAGFLHWARGEDRILLDRTGGLPGPKPVRFAEELLYQQRRRDGDWAIFPNYFCPPALIRNKGRNCVIIHDIQYKRYPEFHSRQRRAWLDFYLPKALASADTVVLISQSERRLVREHFGEAAADRCSVVPNAIDFARLEGSERPSDTTRALARRRYLLSVCHQFPHKNIVTLLKAFAKVAGRDPGLNLVLVGSASEANIAFVQTAMPEALRTRVHLTGFISDADLGILYASALLFVLPSLYEGFGMPAVEALGMGVPTLVSNAYALPEVTLGYAGLIEDPLSELAWAAAIETRIDGGDRPAPHQIAHIRATYSPKVIATAMLSVLHSRAS